MRNIGEFFQRIQKAQVGRFFIQTNIAEVIKKITNIEIPTKNIIISGSKVVLNGISQSAKSEIFIKKGNILKEINTVQEKIKISDIK